MHLHIVGGFGAIGTLVTFYIRSSLSRAKFPITVLHKDVRAASVARKDGGRATVESNGVVRWVFGIDHEQVQSYTEPEANAQYATTGPLLQKQQISSGIESLILPVKANVAVPIVTQLAPYLSTDSTIVLLHNGMGVYEDLLKDVFRNPENRPHIVVSSNTHGAWSKRRGYSVHAGVGAIQLGIMPDGRGRDFEATVDTSLPRALRRTNLDDITPGPEDPQYSHYTSLRETIRAFTLTEGLHATWRPVHDVQMAMRRKLVVNCFVNPLTALLNCKNVDLFTTPAGERLCKQLCTEASHVFRAQWEEEMKEQTSALGDRFPRELMPGALMEECKRVVEITGANISSTLVDILLARDTEMKYLNGYIIRLAKQYHVPVHGMVMLANMMQLRCAIPLDSMHPMNEVL